MVALIFGVVFSTWAARSEGKYISLTSSQTNGAKRRCNNQYSVYEINHCLIRISLTIFKHICRYIRCGVRGD